MVKKIEKREKIILASRVMMFFSAGSIYGIFFSTVFDLTFWIQPIIAVIVTILGLLLTIYSKKVTKILDTRLTDNKANQLSICYNLIAVIIFMSPLILFIYYVILGEINFLILAYSIINLYYFLKFVDYQTLLKPRTVEANIWSVIFLIFSSINMIILPIFVNLIPDEMRHVTSSILLAAALYTHGGWILNMRESSGKDLAEIHPKLYHEELPFRGLYNILAAYFFLISLGLDILFTPRTFMQIVGVIVTIATIVLVTLPHMISLLRLTQKIKLIKTQKKHKKLRRKMLQDNWENEIISNSIVANFLNKFVWFLIVISITIGISLVYYCIYTFDFALVFPAFFLFTSAFTIIRYRVSTKGENLMELLRLFKGQKLTPSSLRRYANIALMWYFFAIALLSAPLIFFREAEIEKPLFNILGTDVTNLLVLTLFFIASIFAMAYLSFRVYCFSKKYVTKKNVRTLSMVIVLTTITMIVAIDSLLLTVISNNIWLTAGISAASMCIIVYIFYKITQAYQSASDG